MRLIESKFMSAQLISTFLFGSNNPDYYSTTDRVVRPDRKIDLQAALELAEHDPIWGHRGRAIQSYAILEQTLSNALANFGGMTRENATTIFYKITNTGSRSKILERLLRRKFGTIYNLFWNAYFKELTRIDLRRSEIVHWLSAMNVALNTDNMMIMGITLIAPDSVKNQPDPQQITSKDLVAFSDKCDAFSRLCNMFIGVVSNDISGDAAKPWLDIFQRPLIYPLPGDHPLLNQTPPTPDSQPPTFPA
jgi:hypothetical protein